MTFSQSQAVASAFCVCVAFSFSQKELLVEIGDTLLLM